MRTVLAVFCLGLLLVRAPAGASERKVVPVPLWSDFDGTRWGDLTLDQTTRAMFEQEYSSRSAGRSGALEARTSSRMKTDLYVVFNGRGPDATLAWIVCYYNGGATAPTPVAFEGRYAAREIEGYPSTRRAGWRLLASQEQGVTAVVEGDQDGERVVALVMGRPDRMTELVNRKRPSEGDDPPAGTSAADTLRAQIGQIDVNVYVAPDTRVDRERLRRDVQQSAEERVRGQSLFRMTDGSDGTLSATLSVEPRQPGDKRHLQLVAHVTLDAEGGNTAIHTRTPDERRSIEADSSDQHISDEARRLINRGIDAVARTASDQLRKQQGKSTEEARQQARVALIDFLAGAAR
jgi:hypothetical protein